MSSSQDHRDQDVDDGIHIAHAFTYASEALRLAAALASTDVGKIALQTDTMTLWVLTAAPGTWKQIGGDPIVRVDATTARTLALTDSGTKIRFTSGSAVAVTVPTNAVVPFPIGTTIAFKQEGAGQVTVSGAGVTFHSSSTLATAAQYANIAITKDDTDTWNVVGERG